MNIKGMDIGNKQLFSQAEQLYRVKPHHEITTGGSGNRIFEVEAGQQPYILRVSEATERKKSHIRFESRWVEYLSAHMEGIAGPVLSAGGHLFEVIEAAGKSYILYLQEKAPGKIVDPNNSNEFNPTLFFHLGRLMGHMHKLTISYKGNTVDPEFEWNGPHFWRKNIPIRDEEVRQSEKRFLQELAVLPVNNYNYGIVHFDIHTVNFHVTNDKITLIDFEACQFNWYAADIASAVFLMIQKGAGPLKRLTDKERTEFAETYLTAYLKGYLQTHSISRYQIYTIDLFMKYQMIDEYVAAQSYWTEEPDQHLRQWYSDWFKERIIHDLSYVHIDYDKVMDGVGFTIS